MLSSIKVMLRLTRMVSPLLPLMLVSITLGIVANASAIAFMAVGGHLLAKATQGVAGAGLVTAFIALAIIRGTFRYLEQLTGHDVAFRLLASIRDKIYTALRSLAPAKLTDKRSSDIVSTIMADVEYIEVFFAHTIAPVIIGIVVPIGVLFFLGLFWWGFALVMLLLYGAVLLFPALLSSQANAVGRTYRRDLASMNSHLLDHLYGLKEVIQFNKGKSTLDTIAENSYSLNESTRKLRQHEGVITGVADAIVLMAGPILLILGLWRLQLGALTPAELLIVVAAGASSFGPVLAVGALSNPLTHTIAAAERVFKLLDEEPVVQDTGTQKLSGSLEIAFDNVTFAYPGNREAVLNNFSLSIQPGEKVALVGKSGNGKTTALRMLLRFWDTSEGVVKIGGQDIRQIPLKELPTLMSLVTQDTYLFNGSIAENLRIAKPDASREELLKVLRAASIDEFVLGLPQGYDTPVGELGDQLSGGERQRIAVARALLHGAPILLLDEATSSLDVLNEKRILKTISTLFKDKTVVTVSHRPSTICNSERICLLEDGHIIEEGSYSALMATQTRYRKMIAVSAEEVDDAVAQ